MKNIIILLSLSILYVETYGQINWEIDLNKSKITFVIDGPFGSDVDGKFSAPKGTVVFDLAMLETASFNVSIESNSINTDNKARDEHLRKEEFFDVPKYKTISFSSTKVEKTSSGFLVYGNLKMKDKSKPVKIPFAFIKNGNVGTWSGNININRLDFGVGKSSFMVGDEVKIKIELVATNK